MVLWLGFDGAWSWFNYLDILLVGLDGRRSFGFVVIIFFFFILNLMVWASR